MSKFDDHYIESYESRFELVVSIGFMFLGASVFLVVLMLLVLLIFMVVGGA